MSQAEVDTRAQLRSMQCGLPPCLHVPIGARDLDAIRRFVGNPTPLAQSDRVDCAFLVHMHDPPQLDHQLPIWTLQRSAILHEPRQVWVHVEFSQYRRAYQRAFPEADLTTFVLDHVLNRRSARIKGFQYVRIVPISRAANSSSGSRCEKLGVEHHRSEAKRAHPCTFVQHADLADLVKMLNIETGGGFLDAINEAQRLVGGQVLPRQGLG